MNAGSCTTVYYALHVCMLVFSYNFQITGGSSGIGKALALEAARQGASVTIMARNMVRSYDLQLIVYG